MRTNIGICLRFVSSAKKYQRLRGAMGQFEFRKKKISGYRHQLCDITILQ